MIRAAPVQVDYGDDAATAEPCSMKDHLVTVAGSARRNELGKMMRVRVCQRLMPNALAASICPLGMFSTAPRTISAV